MEKTIGVLGAGTMGIGIAQVAAQSGHQVILADLNNQQLEKALREIERVGKKKYICVESYRNEEEKTNLLYWQVTCEQFNTPDDWDWWFKITGYAGDHSFIYFD